jgi:hypothetical protein
MAIASFVFGIILFIAVGSTSPGLPLRIPGLGLGLTFLGSLPFALPAGIVGLILGSLAVRKKAKRCLGIAGIVLNALVVLWLATIIVIWSIIGD